MKPVKFWINEVKLLSSPERACLADAFRSLLSWDILKKEHGELDLIKKILEVEIRFTKPSDEENRTNKKRGWIFKDLAD